MRHAYFYANTVAQQQPQRSLDPQQQQGSVNEYQACRSGERHWAEHRQPKHPHDPHGARPRMGLRSE
jgi:hypothetical protein